MRRWAIPPAVALGAALTWTTSSSAQVDLTRPFAPDADTVALYHRQGQLRPVRDVQYRSVLAHEVAVNSTQSVEEVSQLKGQLIGTLRDVSVGCERRSRKDRLDEPGEGVRRLGLRNAGDDLLRIRPGQVLPSLHL